MLGGVGGISDDAADIFIASVAAMYERARELQRLPRLVVRRIRGCLHMRFDVVILPRKPRPKADKERAVRRIAALSAPIESAEIDQHMIEVGGRCRVENALNSIY